VFFKPLTAIGLDLLKTGSRSLFIYRCLTAIYRSKSRAYLRLYPFIPMKSSSTLDCLKIELDDPILRL
jgi:hypothetical protein